MQMPWAFRPNIGRHIPLNTMKIKQLFEKITIVSASGFSDDVQGGAVWLNYDLLCGANGQYPG